MISFLLRCANGHEFEGWFSNGNDFDSQQQRGLVECPLCADRTIEKALMAPALARPSKGERAETMPVMMDGQRREALKQLHGMVRKIRETSEDVGERFAEEARKIHYGEAEQRGIYGQASSGEIRSLAEEGVPFMPLPALPEDQN